MLQLKSDYAEAIRKVLEPGFFTAQPKALIQRLKDAGLSFSQGQMGDAHRQPIQDPVVRPIAEEFVANSERNRGYLNPRTVVDDLIALCDAIDAARQKQAAEPEQASQTPPEIAPASDPNAANPTPPSTPVPADVSLTSTEPLLPVEAAAGGASGLVTETEVPAAKSSEPAEAQPGNAIATTPDPAPKKYEEPRPVRKPATWQDNPAAALWCPPAIQTHLGFEVAYKDNYQTEADASPGWRIVAATHRGRMHAHHGTHREDAFLFHSEKDFTVVCVSDGAGSYQHSRIGSESTCRRVVSVLAEALNSRREELAKLKPEEFNVQLQTLVGAAVKAACDFLIDLAAKTETKPKDFRCTLVLGVLWLAGETPMLVFSQVGDGFMAGQKKDGEAQRYGESDSGAFSGEVNCFMPDADAVHNAQHVVAINAANADAFIFCSDGIEDPFYPTEKKSQAIFQQLREGVSEPLSGFEKQKPHDRVIGSPDAKARLAAWLDFEKKGENDDRTILILHRSPSQLAVVAKAEPAAETPAADGPPAAVKPE